MWLIEDTVQLPRKYDRKIIKDEINKVLAGFSFKMEDGSIIRFVEKGAIVGENFTEVNSGPNKNYLDSNPFEIYICICGKSKLSSELATEIAKNVKMKGPSLKENDFEKTCNNINYLLGKYSYELIIFYVEQSWVEVWEKKKNKQPGSEKNISTFITYLKKKKKQSQNINEKGCCVLYGI